jgi:hypothetical protein
MDIFFSKHRRVFFKLQMRNIIGKYASLEHVDDFMSFYHDIKPILLSGKPRSA